MVQRKPALTPAQNPVCTVCIANYNGADTLEACLNSVQIQDCDFEFEIIVHDDASTDGGVRGFPERFPKVDWLISEVNVGFCVSNNRMVELARGEFVLLLNNDAELFPDALRKLAERGRGQPPAILGLPQYEMPGGQLIDRGSLLDPFLNPLPNRDLGRRDVGMVIGACMWLPRKMWHELGGFPDWFHTLAEDMYLCCRARLSGYAVEVLPDSGFRHWVGRSLGGGKVVDTGLRTTRRRRALSERNKTFTLIVCYPGLAMWVLLPIHLLLLSVEGIVLTALKRDLSLWRDIYARCIIVCWQTRGVLWRTRVEAQAMRRATFADFFAPHTLLLRKLVMLARYGVPDITR